MARSILSVIAGIIFLIAFIPYIRAILQKETKPAKASWIIWASLDTVTFAAMYAKGALNGQIVGAIVGAWVVVLLALRFGASGWTSLDKFSLVGAAAGIALWALFKNPTLALVTCLIVALLGSFPTFVSAWKNPAQEDRTAWILFWLSCLFALPAIPSLRFEDWAQPATFTAIETIMMYILCVRGRSFVRSNSTQRT